MQYSARDDEATAAYLRLMELAAAARLAGSHA
jgi:hypothetical protein